LPISHRRPTPDSALPRCNGMGCRATPRAPRPVPLHHRAIKSDGSRVCSLPVARSNCLWLQQIHLNRMEKLVGTSGQFFVFEPSSVQKYIIANCDIRVQLQNSTCFSNSSQRGLQEISRVLHCVGPNGRALERHSARSLLAYQNIPAALLDKPPFPSGGNDRYPCDIRPIKFSLHIPGDLEKIRRDFFLVLQTYRRPHARIW
jgi:hypothetical protein